MHEGETFNRKEKIRDMENGMLKNQKGKK